jgi:tetratricopeptide (TPR) repeat protein/DNA-binding winged helix-turn-helix (wHTH) protein
MDSPERQIYRFEDVEVDVMRRNLRRGGEDRRLRQKTFQVLVYLIEHHGRDVSKDQIIRDVWKDTAVVDDVLVQSITDIRRALGDDAHHPRFVMTIPKTGYRFIGELEEEEEAISGEEETTSKKRILTARDEMTSASSISSLRSLIVNRRPVLIVVSVLLIVLSVFFFLSQTFRQPSAEVRLPQSPGKKPIAVMFFENQAKSQEFDWLCEGLADMLIAGLSRSSNLTVLSRGQLHIMLERGNLDPAEKVRLNDALEIARLTGAEAIVTGSFAQLGDKVRVEIQLYNARTGDLDATESLIVETPDQILTEIDLLSRRLANRIGVEGDLVKPSGLTEVMTNNLEAYRYYSLGVEKVQALQNKEAIDLLEKAVERDPGFAMAHARIGYAYAVAWGLAEKGKPHLERAFQLSARLTEKDRLNIAAWYAIANLDYPAAIRSFHEIIAKYPFETEAYWRLGRLLLGEEQFDESLKVLKQGLVVDPDAKDIYNALGVTYRDMNRHAESIAMSERYVSLAPNEPNAYDSLALAFQAAGQYERAEAVYAQALAINPNFDVAVLHRANLYFQTGRYNAAVKAYEDYIQLAVSDWDKAWGWGRIAIVNWRRGQLRQAAAAAEKELKLDNNSFASSLIVALEKADEPKADRLKQKLYEQSLYSERGLRPSLRQLFYLRGFAALKSGQTDEAVQNFTEVLRHRPMVWDIDSYEDCLANAYSELGRFAEAVAEYERILKLNPNYPLATFHLAEALRKMGQIEPARENYRLFLESWRGADVDLPAIISARKFISD